MPATCCITTSPSSWRAWSRAFWKPEAQYSAKNYRCVAVTPTRDVTALEVGQLLRHTDVTKGVRSIECDGSCGACFFPSWAGCPASRWQMGSSKVLSLIH